MSPRLAQGCLQGPASLVLGASRCAAAHLCPGYGSATPPHAASGGLFAADRAVPIQRTRGAQPDDAPPAESGCGVGVGGG